MRPDKEWMRLIRLVTGLKRRRIFVSLIVTNSGTRVSYWDSGLREVVTTDPCGAQLHLNALEENDRCELEAAGRRMGRAY